MTMFHGDCLDILPLLDADSIDSCVTDPPYGLSFMNKHWDHDVPSVEIWREVYRVLKPGAYLLAFFGTRTYHRGVVNIEDAGFEIRDQVQWTFGSGFPKSHDVSKAIDKHLGVEREVLRTEKFRDIRNGHGRGTGDGLNASEREGPVQYLDHAVTAPATAAAAYAGWGTALKPAHEPIVVARKPLIGTVAENVLRYGTGGLNIDGCRVGTDDDLNGGAYSPNRKPSDSEWARQGGTIHSFTGKAYEQPPGRWPANICHDGSDEVLAAFPDAKGQQGDVAAKAYPDRDRYNRANFQQGYRPSAYGRDGEASAERRYAKEGGTNFAMTPGPRGGAPEGRWPANICHDGSDEVLAAFPDAKGQQGDVAAKAYPDRDRSAYGAFGGERPAAARVEIEKSAARFFYCAKASKADRNDGLEQFVESPSAASEFRPNHTEKAAEGQDGNPYGRWKPLKNNHPTVKPTDLMRWLCRLVTPPGGMVLDPFAGSGSTGRAAALEGFEFTGIEMDERYVQIAEARIAAAEKKRLETLYE